MRKIFLLFFLSLAACATANFRDMQLSPAGARVKLVENRQFHCSELGKIEAESYVCAHDEKYMVNYLRNLAAKKGATHLRVKGVMMANEGSMQYNHCTGEAYAYDCEK